MPRADKPRASAEWTLVATVALGFWTSLLGDKSEALTFHVLFARMVMGTR